MADERPQTHMLFHGTDIDSARNLLQGEGLHTASAAAYKIDGPPGFFLTTELDDAVFFALRRAPGGVLAYRLSDHALAQLLAAGAVRHPIPPGKTTTFLGDEVIIPPAAFELFNKLRAAGEIMVAPVREE